MTYPDVVRTLRLVLNSLTLGTTNPNKVREYEQLVARECPWITLHVSNVIDPEETEVDLEGNAKLKAKAYAKATGVVTLAEDAGLVVPALQGLPGAFSARFADCELDLVHGRVIAHRNSGQSREQLAARNITRLLDLLRHNTESERAAYFACVIAVSEPDGTILFSARGECHGRIALAPRGTGGFGYDPVFESSDLDGRTFGEASDQDKHAHSHRANAVRQLVAWLRTQHG